MRINKYLGRTGFVAAAMLGSALAFSTANAAILIDFEGPKTDPYFEDGFKFDPSELQSGQCIDTQCPHLNVNDLIVMTYTLGDGVFTLQSLGINFQGQNNVLTIFETADPTNFLSFSEVNYPHTGGDADGYFYLDFGTTFQNVTSISFDAENANVRIDNAMVSVEPIPLPASLPLLFGALAGLGFISRRRRAA